MKEFKDEDVVGHCYDALTGKKIDYLFVFLDQEIKDLLNKKVV